jgi:hypothetical protein
MSKWLWILLSIVLITGSYFLFNPYKVQTYQCLNVETKSSESLTMAKYFYGRLDVTFKNKIYMKNDCKKLAELTCSNIIENKSLESIVYEEDSQILKHNWIEYESGKYVFDKTQVIKSNRVDSYTCELLSK